MIYAGFLKFGPLPISEETLIKAIESFTQSSSLVVRKNSLILCYGKLSDTQDKDMVLENDSSLLMGRTFDKDLSKVFKIETFKSFSDLSTKEALSKIWGKYVYISVNKKLSQFEIVVDSTGQLPFFYHLFPDGSLLFSSDIEILFKILNQRPEYNWEYLCSYLAYGNSSSVHTPFKNVFELPPACSLHVTKEQRKTTPFWNPLNSYKNIELQEEGAVSVLKKTLQPWIEPYQTVCVSLSGGLDSSSLVYCLKEVIKKNQTLTALNFFHSQVQSSNELTFARKVCEETGIKLIEVDLSNSLPFDPPQRIHPLKPNKPFPGLVGLKCQEAIFDKIDSTGSFTFLSGHGSDHIFMRPPSQKSVSDYIFENGLKGYKNKLESLAQFYRNPLFSIFKVNFISLFKHSLCMKKDRRYHKEKTKNIPIWVKNDLKQNLSTAFCHPIYDHLSQNVLPGKFEQVDILYEGISSIHIEMMDQTNPTFYPFLYEPTVEFALSFPTYELFNKGYDRYPLRKSVSNHYKTDTVWRRDKSQTTGIFQLGVKKNLERVLDLCLNGHLVQQKFIDKQELHKTITLIGNGDVKHMWPFTQLASIELFLRTWDEKKFL